jgi:hypothetical protein
MSTLAADTITNVAGSSAGTTITIDKDSTYNSEGTAVTQNLVQGVAKVWANINGTGTPAARYSFNVTSITDHATGILSIVIANDMGNNEYVAGGIVQRNASTTENGYISVFENNYGNAFATGSIKLSTTRPDNASDEDMLAVLVTIHGDLA